MSLGAKVHDVNYNDVHLSGNSCLTEEKNPCIPIRQKFSPDKLGLWDMVG